jgi:FkbM family methyltransferase
MADERAGPIDDGSAALGALRLAPCGPAGAYRLRQCRYGPMLFNRFDRFVGRSLDHYGEYSEPEAALLRSLLRPGDIVIEAGANIGAHTVAMARAVGETGRILAFEPQRLVFQLLCANLALNELVNVDARPAGLGSAPGSVRLPVVLPGQEFNFGGLPLAGHGTGERVPIETIDGLRLKSCRLIKADVEGMEREVLLGAEATIARCRPMLHVENDRRENSPALLRLIMGWRYRAWWDFPPLYNLDNFARNAENIFPRKRSLNVLCIPEESPQQAQTPPIASPDEWIL